MTELELLDLIHYKTADELSMEEIDELRQAVLSSPELRREFAERVEMEQYLVHALARVNVSVEQIIARADRRGLSLSNTKTWALVVLALLGGSIGLAVILAIVAPAEKNPPATAKLDRPSKRSSPRPKRVAAKAVETKTKELDKSAPSAPTTVDQVAAADAATQVAAVAAATPDVPKVDPWDVAIDDSAPASPFELFAGVDAKIPAPQVDDLKQWFANVEGQRGDFAVRDIQGGRWGTLDGLFRLRAPLKPGAALRLAIRDYTKLRFHFWSGKSGVTFDYFNLPTKPWVAYATSRNEAEPIPINFLLAGRDDDRFWRTNPKELVVLELRHADGILTLSIGDVRLLSVPMQVAPTEIYWEGNAVVRQIRMVRAAELPTEVAPRPVSAELVPAKQAWLSSLEPGGKLEQRDDGGSVLSAEKNPQPVWASFRLPLTGVQELIFEIDAPQFGTGIYLGDADGKPRYLLSFLRDQHNKDGTQLSPHGVGDARVDAGGNVAERPMTYVGSPTWVRLVFGSGMLKFWTSIDGVHWARGGDPVINLVEGFNTVGLYATQGEPARKITLRKFTLREFDALNALASVERRTIASEFAAIKDFTGWREAAKQAAPPDVDAADWLRACALRRLAFGTSKELGDELLMLLWQDSLQLKLPTSERFRLLDDIVTIAPTWDDPARAARYLGLYAQLGNILADLDKPRVFSRVVHAQMTAPIWSQQVYRFISEGLARHEVLELAVPQRWDELDAFCRRFNYWSWSEQTTQPDFFKWAAALAAQRLPKDRTQTGPVWSTDWRHPLVTELSKEGFNVLADLRVALDNQSYRDACQVISSATNNGMLGLLPDTQDPDLNVSLPATVAIAMHEHPQFRETMNEQFGPLGRLRVRQAIASGDAAAVEAATLHFFATEAAAEAHIWLGDRALSSGAFADARGHYRGARANAPPELISRLAASEQLAAALMGRDAGQPIQETISFGETRLSAAELQNLTNELRSARAAESAIGQDVAARRETPLPPPRDYEVAPLSRLEGEAGENPGGLPAELQRPGAGWAPLSIDWVARQAGVLVAGDRLLVSNRFQLASYDLTSGLLQWRAGLAADQAPTHDWAQTPMRPLATGSRVFVRRLRKSGPMLAGINIANGQVLWETKLENERWVVSDAALVQGTLYACVVQRTDVALVLSLAAFDPQTGVMLRARPLVNLRESWWRERDCQLLAVDESFVITCGGSVLRCDLLGNVRWARRQLWLPPSVDAFWMFQAQAPPLLSDGRLFVLQAAVPAVMALDPDSGRILWQRSLPAARRILGVAGPRLFVETSRGIQAMASDSGKRLWQFESTDMLDGHLLSATDGLLVAVREPVEKENNRQPVLVWLDGETGNVKHRQPFAGLKHEHPYLGPMIANGSRLWAFYGKGPQDPSRDLLEMKAK